jgi:nicotinamide riboside kinase
MKQICIIGPSGTGKTSIAEYISSRYMIEYITGSSRELSKQFNINSHQDIIRFCANQPDSALSMYMQIYNHRSDILEDSGLHVTDRGIIDLMVYFTLQLAPFLTITEVDQFMKLCKEELNYDDIIFIFTPYTFKHGIDDDGGRRIVNQEYQAALSNTFDIFIKRYLPNANIITLYDWNWDSRVKKIDSIFNDTKCKKFKKWLKRKLRLKQ